VQGSNSLARSSTLRPVWAKATICSLNSAGYGFLVLGIWTLSSKGQSVSIKPGELQLATGARRGELLALRWSDVDFENLRIKIWRSLEETADGLRFKTTKTFHGRHHITLPKEAMVALQAHRRGQMELRLKLCLGRMPDDALVFGKVNGQPQSPRAITKAWSRLVKAHDLPKVTLHGLRHTHASALIASGVDVLTVSRRLGHASPTITLGVYEHLFSDTDSRAADVIGKALSKTIA